MAAPSTNAAEVVSAYFDAFGRRDHERVLALSHPEVELWAQPTAEQTGRATPYNGRDGIRDYLADVDRVWERFEVRPDSVRTAGNGVIAFGRGTGRTAGGGREVDVPLIWVFRVRDGLVVFCRVAKTAAQARQMVGADDRAGAD